ncbi:DUF881 domain-containing protein [Micromonospora endolithica]|uniref:DUF881 domain-containing protein n=1 Tax=Micromonospora endolithica TaxID=230091 RepID=A0A3A9ZDM2_9ACTN|nr:DUF881 domain-containing protein [Micromonospora endolithica]RKN46410.1 DUF881 domain-containing protein [Micromonospora endolithica]TWJ24844.1 uncharacterized protein YlxW (UPF0749 family) [Micromonospora endolithica]
MEYTSGAASWQKALRRAIAALLRRPRRRRPGWSIGVPLIAAAAGLLFTTTATTAGGTALREDRRPQLNQLIEDRLAEVAANEERAAELRRDVEGRTTALAKSDAPIGEQQNRAAASRTAAGFTELAGSGVTVELDDARLGDGQLPEGATNDDLVVHQGDVQAVVNALWAGGAEAMSIMNVRVLATSAVRCVGNTLLLHGRVYSPPFKIVAIGDPAALQQALADSKGVREFRDLVDDYKLGYKEYVSTVSVPAFEDSTTLRSATVPK